MTGHCTACLYTGKEWEYLGPQYEDKEKPPVFYHWNCPCCGSTKSSPSDQFPPPVPAGHPSRPGATLTERAAWLLSLNRR